MRKILGYILLLISVISLFGCDNSTEESNTLKEVSFEQYLNENGNFSISQIDNRLNKKFVDELPSIVIADKKFNKHIITAESKEDKNDYEEFGKIYSWQEQTRLYISSCSTNNDLESSYYINLEDLESLYSNGKSYFSIYLEEDSISNLIDRSLYLYITTLELENNFDLGFDITSSSILSLISFEYNDFTEVESGYQLNFETIINKICEFTENKIKKEDILTYVTYYNADINIIIGFDGYNITNVNFIGSISMDGIYASVTIDMSLEYLENELSNINLDIVSPILNGNVSFSFEDNNIMFVSDLKVKDGRFYQETYYEISISEEALMFIVKSNGLEQVNAHLKFNINDTISITGDIVLLSGSYTHNNSIFYRYSKFSFSSNDEIVVPESCLSDKLNARNLLANLV